MKIPEFIKKSKERKSADYSQSKEKEVKTFTPEEFQQLREGIKSALTPEDLRLNGKEVKNFTPEEFQQLREEYISSLTPEELQRLREELEEKDSASSMGIFN